MGKTFLKETSKLLQAKRQRKRWRRTVVSMSLVVAMVTSSLLSHPAITMERTTICGIDEHTHGSECYQKQLICQKAESKSIPATEEKVLNCSLTVHEHTDECKDENGEIICGTEAHAHDDGCYQITTTPAVEGHSHTDGCYQDTLTCQKTEHVHNESCYQTEAAPAETAPSTEAPATEAPVTEAPATETPATSAPETSAPATEAPAAETVVEETEKKNNKKKETKKEKEETAAEENWKAQVLTAVDKEYTITVDASAEAQIPQDAALKVRELKKETDEKEYTTYVQQAEAKVQQQLAKDLLYGRYFELTIESEGKEVQPAVPVKVKITYTKAIENPEGSEVKAVYFGDTIEILNALRTNLNNNAWSEAEFEVEDMNVLVLGGIGTAQTAAEAPETEAVTESASEIETEITTEAATELHTEGETLTTESAAEAESETEQTTETEAVSEAEIESETETEPATEDVTENFTETEIEEMTEDTTEAGSEIESESETEVESESESEVVTEEMTEQEIESESETEVESESESEVMTEEMTEQEIESESETEVESESESETEIAANTLTAENSEYSVTVSYDESANLPDNVTLSITNYDENNDEYQAALEAVISAKQDEEGFEADQLQLRALDISILDEEGNELEPESTVSVRIEMKNLPEDWDPANVEVHHIVEEHAVAAYAMERSTARNVSLYADEVASGVAVVNGMAVAEFTTESFSTYTITWHESIAAKYQDYRGIQVVNESGVGIGDDATRELAIKGHTYIKTLASEATPTHTDKNKAYTFVAAYVGKDWSTAESAGSIDDKYSSIIYSEYTGSSSSFTGWRIYNWISRKTTHWLSKNSLNIYLVYAEREVGKEIKLSFDANGGSQKAPDAQYGSIGDGIELPEYTGTNGSNTFLGWADIDNLEGDYDYHRIYQPGDEYVLEGKRDVTLYAVWSNMATNSKTDFYVRLYPTIPTEPKFSLDAADYTSKIQLDGDPDNIVSKHYWIVDTTSRTVDGIYAENTVKDNLKSMPSLDQLVAALNAAKKKDANGKDTNESALGFTVSANDANELVVTDIINDKTNKDGYNVNKGDQLYVLWYVQKYGITDGRWSWHIDGVLLVKERVTITYVKNTNDVVKDMPEGYQQVKDKDNKNNKIKIGVSGSGNVNAEPITPTRTGYTFIGWNTEPDGSGDAYKNGDIYVLDHDTTLYAQWSRGYNYLTVNKTDMDGNVLAGATFKLEEKKVDESGTVSWEEVSSGVTNSKGDWTYSNVRSQTIYRMTETYAPSGYATRNSFYFAITTGDNDEILEIYIVDANGNPISEDSYKEWLVPHYIQATSSGGSGLLNITIKDEQIKRKVIFKKTALDGTPLSDAEFVLKKSDTAVTGVLLAKSGTDGIFSNSNVTLTYGTYVLEETAAPTGYQKAEPITITLNDPTGTASKTDGTYDTADTGITFSGDGAANASVSMVRHTSTEANVVTTTYTYTITVKDKPTADLTIVKADSKTKAKLTGATFKLTKLVGTVYEAVSVEGTASDGTFTVTDANGYQLKGLLDGTYKLTEIKAPAGYIISKDPIEFKLKVNLDGTVSITGLNENLASATSDGTITVLNEAGVALPNTGGSGTLHYTLSGLLLIAAALMYGFVLRRRRERRICG